jgi:hypothetical protein
VVPLTAGHHDFNVFAPDPFEVGAVEGEQALRATLACGRQDQAVVAGSTDEIAATELLQEVPAFLRRKPDEVGSVSNEPSRTSRASFAPSRCSGGRRVITA